MLNEELRDACPHITCGQCQYFNAMANMDNVESTCKRLDHKKYQFAIPWFKSYDCGQFCGCVCKDFEPQESCVYLYNHWKGFEDYFGEIQDTSVDVLESSKGLIGLCINKDQLVRYYVKYVDFVNNTFLDDAGELKWIKRCYYKRSRKSPIGYQLVYEWNENIMATVQN